ncbi:MAG TPA: CopD family protein [Haliangiales bacterium]|nr:CopD family protein [Haliangiales bacterium]
MNEVQLQLLIRAVHILAALLWFAGLFAAGSLLRFRDTETDAGVKQRLGVRSRKAGVLADVGATLSLATGIYQGVTRSLFAQPWLHVKLTLVAVLLVVHVLIRVKARRASEGEGKFGTGLLGIATLAVMGILYAVMFQPLHK